MSPRSLSTLPRSRARASAPPPGSRRCSPPSRAHGRRRSRTRGALRMRYLQQRRPPRAVRVERERAEESSDHFALSA
eukprot:scaffold27406_cov75-Phaeocystis_antarctica.AAC.1